MTEREEGDRQRGESRSRGNAAASSTSSRSASASRLLERGRKVERDARSFVADLDGLVGEVESVVRTRLEAQPYQTLAIAAGAGFVLGGGLTVTMVGMLTKIGTRMATAALMQGALARVFSPDDEGSSS